jgi:hypothetical protein|nr:MAG TPA: hypothetical protein [Caudoviricetes sp.]DAU61724.1 MAG TPA: hypothetical protein [Bacteriophage sp.]
MQFYHNHLEWFADYYCYPIVVVIAMVEYYSNYSTTVVAMVAGSM